MASTKTWFESVAEAQRRAKKRLPASVYGALIAGAESGVTVDDNVAAFRELGFFPRIATGLGGNRDLSTTVLGVELSMPVMISPTGVQAVHPEGEVAVGARRGEGRHRDGAQLVRQQADRGGRRGQRQDVLPGVLDGLARADAADPRPRAQPPAPRASS